MGNRAAKDDLYDALASAARALGVGRRAEMVDVLAQGERSVEDLATQVAQSVANTSHHLKALAAAGLVSRRKDGTRVFYALSSPLVEVAWEAMRSLAAAQLAEFDSLAAAYLGDRSEVPIVTRNELPARVLAGAVLIDVRPVAEYLAGYIAGVLSFSEAKLEDLDAALTMIASAPLISYCRGEFCVFADDAVRALLAAGRDAARLEDGFPQWRRDGLPVVTGAHPGELVTPRRVRR